MTKIACGSCKLNIPRHLQVICCGSCKEFFHVKCCDIKHKDFRDISNKGEIWNCFHCRPKTNDVRKKCGQCCKKIAFSIAYVIHITRIQCCECYTFFHSSCSIPYSKYQERNVWTSENCIRASNPLPFANIDDEKLLLTLTENDLAHKYFT